MSTAFVVRLETAMTNGGSSMMINLVKGDNIMEAIENVGKKFKLMTGEKITKIEVSPVPGK